MASKYLDRHLNKTELSYFTRNVLVLKVRCGYTERSLSEATGFNPVTVHEVMSGSGCRYSNLPKWGKAFCVEWLSLISVDIELEIEVKERCCIGLIRRYKSY